jgi:hypothetical protein
LDRTEQVERPRAGPDPALDDALPHEPAPDDTAPEDPGLVADMRLLADNARSFAQAELAYQKARAAYAGQAARAIAVLGLVAAVLVFFAAMAAVMGAVIALGTVLSPWIAMAAVTFGLLALAALCAGFAAIKAKRMKSVLTEGASNAKRG